MEINLSNSEIVKKFGKDEALHQLLKSLSKPNHKDTRLAWLKELKEKYPEVFDEWLHQCSESSPDLSKSLLEKSLLDANLLENVLLDEFLAEEPITPNK